MTARQASEQYFKLLSKQIDMDKEIKLLTRELGLDRIKHVDHVDGTNCSEWRCEKCGEKWMCPVRLPCTCVVGKEGLKHFKTYGTPYYKKLESRQD